MFYVPHAMIRFLFAMSIVTFVMCLPQIFQACVFVPGGCRHRQTQEMMREEADIADERRLAAKIVAQAKVAAPRLATMGAISEHRNRWVAHKVRSK